MMLTDLVGDVGQHGRVASDEQDIESRRGQLESELLAQSIRGTGDDCQRFVQAIAHVDDTRTVIPAQVPFPAPNFVS